MSNVNLNSRLLLLMEYNICSFLLFLALITSEATDILIKYASFCYFARPVQNYHIYLIESMQAQGVYNWLF